MGMIGLVSKHLSYMAPKTPILHPLVPSTNPYPFLLSAPSSPHLTPCSGRRRKIKCNYPPTPPSSCTSSAPPPRRCIECTTHNRECLIQGFVDPNPSNSNGNVYSNSHFVQNGNGTVISKPKPPRIYKRRRDVSTSLSSSPPLGAQIDDDADTRPRMKIHFDRMNSVVERLAKEQRLRSSTSAIASNANQHLNPSTNGSDRSAGTMNSALNVDVFETSQSFSDDHTASLPNTQQQQPIAECGIGPPTTIPTENYAKESSPLLSQLFNNEIVCSLTFPHYLPLLCRCQPRA